MFLCMYVLMYWCGGLCLHVVHTLGSRALLSCNLDPSLLPPSLGPSHCNDERTAQMLTFHARMSIVTDTLSRASTHLDHFLFVFFLVRPSTSGDRLYCAR